MSYYSVFGLKKEPFSTSPDPEFFYRSAGHEAALKRLEIAIRLRRGLSVILGDVGAGKTTLSRALLGAFAGEEESFEFHLVFDPAFDSEQQFLSRLVRSFGAGSGEGSSDQLKEELEGYLLKRAGRQERIVTLVIDEGQKLTAANLEVLRTLLNYETNQYKLLQLVILAQMELLAQIDTLRNFSNRVALKYVINPLDENETAAMIDFRLRVAGYSASEKLFEPAAARLIYQNSQGCPRTIAMLCHNALELLVMNKQTRLDEKIVEEAIQRNHG